MKNKTVIVVAVLALVTLGVYLLLKRKNQGGELETENSAGISYGGTVPVPQVGNDTVLRRGNNGPAVEELQRTYNQLYAVPNGVTRLAEDGAFGPLTEAAMQEAVGLKAVSINEFKRRVGGASLVGSGFGIDYNTIFGYNPANAPFIQ